MDLRLWLWKDPNVTRKAMACGGTVRRVPGTREGVPWGPMALGNRERINLREDLGAQTVLAPSLGGTSAHTWVLSQG